MILTSQCKPLASFSAQIMCFVNKTATCAADSLALPLFADLFQLAKGMDWLVKFIKITDETPAVCDSDRQA